MKFEESQFLDFVYAVKQYNNIDDCTMTVLLNRYIAPIRKKVFVPIWKRGDTTALQSAKLRYFGSYWLKRLHLRGTIVRIQNGWAVFKG